MDSPTKKTGFVATLFLAEYPLVISCVALLAGLLFFYDYLTGQNFLRLTIPGKHGTLLTFTTTTFFLALFIEVLFRLILRLTSGRIAKLVALLLFVLISGFGKEGKRATNEYFFLWAILALVILWLGMDYYLKQATVFARIESFWQRHFRWIFYALTLVYALFWLNKASLAGWQLLLFPVLLAPSLLISAYLGYVRMTYGFWYAVLVQSLLLSVPLTLELTHIL